MKNRLSSLVAGWIDDFVEDGLDRDSAREAAARVLRDLSKHDREIAKVLDGWIDFEKVLPGALGVAVELGDEQFFQALVKLASDIDDLFRRDPAKVAERFARRSKRKAERRIRKGAVWLLTQALKDIDDPQLHAEGSALLAKLEASNG